MKVGILGGTFDPPHLGHTALANSALEMLSLDEILVVPAGKNPLKRRKDVTPAKMRMQMAELAFGSLDRFAISDIEVGRPGPSYAYETLQELQMASPADYWLIIGSDLLDEIPQWHQPERLLKLCRLGVAIRPPETALPRLLNYPEWLQAAIDVFPIAHRVPISSSEIREQVARNFDVKRWLEPAVLEYIKTHRLYKD